MRSLYPLLPIYVRVRTLADQVELSAMGIKHAGTGYIESTLVRGGMLLKDLGQSEEVVDDLVRGFQRDGYAFIRNAYAEVMPQEAKS